jgi:hypothetical protein
MKKINFILLLLICHASSIFSQIEKEEISYSLEWDNPLFSNIALGVFVGGEANFFSLPVKIGGDLFCNIGPVYFGSRFNVGQQLLNSSRPDNGNYTLATRHSEYLTTIDSYIGVELKSFITTENKSFILESVNTGSTVTNYYINIPVKVKTSYGLEVAYNITTTPFTAKPKHFVGELYTNRGTEYNFVYNTRVMSTMLNLRTLHVGVGRIVKSNVIISTENYGIKKFATSTRAYARLSFWMDSFIDDVLEPTGWDGSNGRPYGYRRVKLDGITPLQVLGYNVGISTLSPFGFGGFGFVELGAIPGPKVGLLGRAYFSIGGGLSVSALFDGYKD